MLFIFSCVPYESKEIIIPDGKAIPKEIINNSKLIELHDKAFDAGRETIVFDDGETYLVQDKRLSNKKVYNKVYKSLRPAVLESRDIKILPNMATIQN